MVRTKISIQKNEVKIIQKQKWLGKGNTGTKKEMRI